MRRVRSLFVLCSLFLLAVGAAARADDPKPPPKADDTPNAPGAIHPFNATGKFKNRFHEPTSDHDLDPLAIVVTRDLEFGAPLKSLLTQLDAAVEKNPNVRLAVYVLFLSDDLPEVVGADDKTDDKRVELAAKLEGLANGLKLQHVVLCLDDKADLEKYKVENATFAFILLHKLRILSQISVKDEKLGDGKVKEALAALDKVGATRK